MEYRRHSFCSVCKRILKTLKSATCFWISAARKSSTGPITLASTSASRMNRKSMKMNDGSMTRTLSCMSRSNAPRKNMVSNSEALRWLWTRMTSGRPVSHKQAMR